jgi:mono/diheme cytochrome c family protein
MSAAKTSKALMSLLAILALLGAALITGCGSSSGTTTTPAAEESSPAGGTAEESGEEAAGEAGVEEEAGGEEAAAGEGAIVAEGKEIFVADCGSCHTLQAAGTSGTVGPNLDELAPEEAAVEQQVFDGGGPMPAFGKEGTLDAEEIKAVATFVSHEAGKE